MGSGLITLPGGIEITLWTLAVALVVVFALRAFFRGVVRLFFGMACLAVGAWVGFEIFRTDAALLIPVVGERLSPKAVITAAWVGGGLTYGVLALGARAFANTLAGDNRKGGPARLAGAALSLIPAAFALWVAASLLRTSGLISELASTDTAVAAEDGVPKAEPDFWARTRVELESGWLGRLMKKTDPLTEGETGTLSQVLLLLKDADAWARIKSHPQLANVLADPRARALAGNPDVLAAVAQSDYRALVNHPSVAELAHDAGVARQLRSTDVPAAIDDVLYEIPRALPLDHSAIPAGDPAPPRGIPVRHRRSLGPPHR